MEEASGAMASPEPLLRSSVTRPPEAQRSNRLAAALGRAAGRRGASMLVRESAARQLEERRADWAYSRPVVALDMLWNLAFAAATVVVLSSSLQERPNVPLRLWVAGYALQCVVHVLLVWLEYQRRNSPWSDEEGFRQIGSDSEASDNAEAAAMADGFRGSRSRSVIAKRCESFNTVASFFWWIVGFYWVVSGGETLMHNAPKLYWLAVVFLAFDVFFTLFCLALACVIGIALCCCLPCIIAILYALAGQEGASDADISILPRYRFSEAGVNEQKLAMDSGVMIPLGSTGDEVATERMLLHEDAECCICLTPYEDGAELHSLPCNHHFHSACITKWLRIHATCPLCKYNILKGNEHV